MIRARRSAAVLLVLGADRAVAQQPTIANAIGMEFVLVQPGRMLVGTFQPACPDSTHRPEQGVRPLDPPTHRPDQGVRPLDRPLDPARAVDSRTLWNAADYARCAELAKRDAMPGFMATISRPYYIGKYEVTQAEWKKVVGTNPSVFQGSKVKDDADRHPVDNVTWADAQRFVQKLNAMDRTAHYRLPTELEWEYAARAGANQEPTWAYIHDVAWEQDIDKGTTHAVGGKRPNAWGLYDTLGNVWEWVGDVYNEKLFPDAEPPRTGTTHVLRGGSFVSDVKNTTWFTHAGGPGSGFDVGFRIVREVR